MKARGISGLALSAGLAALAGGLLWGVKSTSILITGEQPDFVFEVAPFFFATAAVGVVSVWEQRQVDPSPRMRWIAYVAVVSGGVAAVAYIVGGDEAIFGPAVATTVLLVVGLLGYTGRGIRDRRSLGAWSMLPLALALSFLLSIPVGGALESLSERLLEIPLLLISIGWVLLARPLTNSITS